MAYMAILKNQPKRMKGRNKGTGMNKEASRESGQEKEDEEDIKAREGTRHKGK